MNKRISTLLTIILSLVSTTNAYAIMPRSTPRKDFLDMSIKVLLVVYVIVFLTYFKFAKNKKNRARNLLILSLITAIIAVGIYLYFDSIK